MADNTEGGEKGDDAENFQVDTSRLLQQPDANHDEPPENMALLNPLLHWYFFFAGQWFAPVTHIIESKGLPRKPLRFAYSIWQGIVVIIMWSFFAYSMGLYSHLRTLEEVDWLCPLTDIKKYDARTLLDRVSTHRPRVFLNEQPRKPSEPAEHYKGRRNKATFVWMDILRGVNHGSLYSAAWSALSANGDARVPAGAKLRQKRRGHTGYKRNLPTGSNCIGCCVLLNESRFRFASFLRVSQHAAIPKLRGGKVQGRTRRLSLSHRRASQKQGHTN